MKLINISHSENLISINKTIMNFTIRCIKELNRSNNILVPLNQVRLYKKMYLPCKLIDINRDSKTKEFYKKNSRKLFPVVNQYTNSS